jgi:conflict system pore-forming effector with SLATT domain
VHAPSRTPAITTAMRELRRRSLSERRQAYLIGRISNQHDWYLSRADQHGRRANRIQAVGLLLEVVGVAAALCKVLRIVTFDLAGIIAAMIAALAAWMAGKQYRSTVTAYTLASHELSIIRPRPERAMPAAEWSELVADAEAAISREHTTWRASHRR